MKKVAYYYGVNTPAHAFFGLDDLHPTDNTVAAQQCAAAVEGLRWPLIVKHHSGYSSIGMGRDCKVESVEELLPQVRGHGHSSAAAECKDLAFSTRAH
jgi:D-alanine-D-alanine ligase